MARRTFHGAAALWVVGALVLASCTGGGESSDATETTGADEPAALATTTTIEPSAELPATPAGDALGWLLDRAGARPDADELSQRFDEAFLEAVPAVEVSAVLVGLGADPHLREIRHATETELVAIVRFRVGLVEVQLTVEPEPPHRFTSLLVVPHVPAPDAPTSLDAVGPAWSGLAPDASLVVAEVNNGECQPFVEVDADRYGPIGSTFKLYVLGAVATAVDEGILSWDDPLPIRDDLKSHPSGTFHELAAGTVRTVEQHARAMIETSDNTATDHLIDAVGRDAVEAAMVAMGHSRPELNRPFLTTRELFLLKLGGVDDELAAYLDADEAGRRALLDSWRSLDLPPIEHAPQTATLIHELEWFASPNDLCRAMVVLEELARWPGLEPIDAIMAAPTDLVVRPDATVWFKGGSEPGVLNATLLTVHDGTVVVVSGTLTDAVRIEVDQAGTVEWLARVADLVLG